jgi:endonuclease/exonuclease/phosphatase family metal-dependent hydrolase
MLEDVRRLALATGILCSFACATARNYLDPSGPRVEASFGEVRDADPSLHIVTFNIEHGQRVEQAIAGLRDHAQLRGADVLLLQEMTADGVEAIARALSLNTVYYPAYRVEGRDTGNAILSPWPIEASWKVPLPHLTRVVGKSRSAVAARLRIDGRPIVVYSVHLGSPLGLSPGRRRAQAEAVLADANRDPSQAVVIAGDFNSRSVGRVFIRDGFRWATRATKRSIFLFSFDHVFTRGLGTEGRAGVARDVNDASDHLPVWALLSPRPATH